MTSPTSNLIQVVESAVIDESPFKSGRVQTKDLNTYIVEFKESGEKISIRMATLILLSISFGVGYLFLPITFFIKQGTASFFLLLFNYASGFISIYMLMDIRAQIKLGSYQELAYYMGGNRSSILGISLLFAAFFGINCSVYLQLLGKFTLLFFNLIADHLFQTQLWDDSILIIIFLEALIIVPICKTLNFQTFKNLTYPILITILLIFISLYVIFIVRASLGYANDFCQVKITDFGIPSAEYGVIYANVITSLCYAFGFQIYFLQVHNVVDRSDPTGRKGLKIGMNVLTAMFIVYGSILLLAKLYDEPHNRNQIIYVYDLVFNAGDVFKMITQVIVIVQLFCHMPFIFYIANEQILIFVDELTRQSMSKMLDEKKKIDGRSKRYVTEELKTTECNIVITSYRLPYMTMPKKTQNIIFWASFSIIVIIALSQFQLFFNSISAFGATCVPLSVYVIPGYYYSRFHRGYSKRKYYGGLAFAIFGFLTMIIFTGFMFYSFSNINILNH